MTEAVTRFDTLHELASPLISALELASVRAVRAEVELLDERAAANIGNSEEQEPVEVTAGRSKNGDFVFRLHYEAVLRDRDGNDAARSLLEFVVRFRASSELDPSEEEIGAFAEVLVIRIVHPYYREGLSSLMSRIGIGPITLGLLRPDQSTTEGLHDADSAGSANPG